ncbi:sensor histidine kinase [Aquibacillus sediminis]|uniref:sensor histidine kinase n=1 Tax=Aquibacillus sediminis TaxID=2574734 RepID=UPI001FE4558E|nr:sensor histidine kinase [Aquibacillus sediminis]
MIRNWSLKKKFLTIFLIFISLPTILFGMIIYYQATEAFKDQAEQNITSRLEKNEENLTTILRSAENISSYMIYDENVRTFLSAPIEDAQRLREAEDAIRGYFTFEMMSNNYIDSVELTGNQGNQLLIGNPVITDEEKLIEKAKQKQGAPYWSNVYTIASEWNGANQVISLNRVINDINTAEPIGTVTIRLDGEEMYETIDLSSNQQGEYFVLSEQGEVVLHQDNSLLGELFPNRELMDLIINREPRTQTFSTSDNNYLVVKNKVAGTDWFSVVMVNEKEVVQGLYSVRSSILNLIILLALLGVIAFIGFYYWIIKPVTELSDQTKQFRQGDFTANVFVNSNDEIGKLGKRFNKMVSTIQKHIDTEYKLKIEQKESELKALQNQIDPHFLYNTLDMIRWTARIENAMETGQLIERLSKIFRMNLNKGSMWVTVEEELTYIYNYLELQRSRMGPRMKFTIYYDEQVKQYYLIKQLLQPLVENSIVHGFKDLSRQGTIYIRCYQVDQMIWIDIIDNGRGFTNNATSFDEQRHSGYALSNLKERMKIAFNQNFEMDWLDVEQGAWVRLKIPIVYPFESKEMSKE